MYTSNDPQSTLASELSDESGFHQFYWVGRPGERGAKVISEDRDGMRWTFEAATGHLVPQRIAAGLLGVSLMSINTWVREGRFGEKQYRNGVSVIPLRAIEDAAVGRKILSG